MCCVYSLHFQNRFATLGWLSFLFYIITSVQTSVWAYTRKYHHQGYKKRWKTLNWEQSRMAYLVQMFIGCALGTSAASTVVKWTVIYELQRSLLLCSVYALLTWIWEIIRTVCTFFSHNSRLLTFRNTVQHCINVLYYMYYIYVLKSD